MKCVRVGVVGLGHAGMRYARYLARRRVPGAQLAAVVTSNPRKVQYLENSPRVFSNVREMAWSTEVDAVIVATPHHDHVRSGTEALKAKLHLLVDKPLAATLTGARTLVAAGARRQLVQAIMLNLRADPAFREIRRLIREGAIGTVRRVHWTFTTWYRTEAYFRSSWRGTWRGEGGGILVNQAIHHIDLLQWWLGRPAQVWAHCEWGKYHDIEVEDEVVALWRYPNGGLVTLVFSTGEAPGWNHLEIFGDRGSIWFDGSHLEVSTLKQELREHTQTADDEDGKPGWVVHRRRAVRSETHLSLLRNFVEAIRSRTPLIAPLKEGLASVEIANALQLSAWCKEWIGLPLDERRYMRELKKKLVSAKG